MGVVVKYVHRVGGRYVYRRAVPESLRSALNKREVKIPLGSSQAEMTRRYSPTHAEVEKLFKLARTSLAPAPQSSSVEKTDLDLVNEAIEQIQSMGWSAQLGHADETEREHRQITRELELEKYRRNKHGGYEGVPPEEAAFIRALTFDEIPAWSRPPRSETSHAS